MRTRPIISKALGQIEHGSEVDACEAAKQLADANGKAVVAGLTRILRSAGGQWSREMAAYALSWNKSREAVGTLLVCANDPDEADSVRGQAVEGLAMHLQFVPVRSRVRRKAEGLMIEILRSPSPTLRFWACFGLGTLGCRRAIPQLRKLKRTDRSVCPGWWYVREEAEDALERIQGRPGKEREPLHMRSNKKPKAALKHPVKRARVRVRS